MEQVYDRAPRSEWVALMAHTHHIQAWQMEDLTPWELDELIEDVKRVLKQPRL